MGFDFALVWATGDNKKGGYVVASKDGEVVYFAHVVINNKIRVMNTFKSLQEAIDYIFDNLDFLSRGVEE